MWNDTSTDDDIGVAVSACSVLVDEFNFWSKYSDETRITELGNRMSRAIHHRAYSSTMGINYHQGKPSPKLWIT